MHVRQTEVILRHEGAELVRVMLPPGDYVIGRSSEAEISADTPLLSRRHARLTIDGDGALLEDLGSSNGTFVAGETLAQPTLLERNQEIRLGVIMMEVTPLPSQDETVSKHLLPPELFAARRYKLGREIARGGMGAILGVEEGATQRTVAMKVMLDTRRDAHVRRFVKEARVTAQLDHPNIVPIYDFGLDERGQPFYTMKMVRGITLKKVLQLIADGVEATVRKYPLPALLTVFQKACDAVAFAHAKGVIHRDLKPENIMMGDFGSVLVMDWGLAKVLGKNAADTDCFDRTLLAGSHTTEGDDQHTQAGTVMGTPQYMSPEQARGEVSDLDARSDIFSLGAILFQILYLRPIATGKSGMEMVQKVARAEIDWTPSKKGAPASLIAVCRRALALRKDARYQCVEDLQRDLIAYQSGFATSAERAGPWKQLCLLVGRHRATSLGLAAALAIGGTFGSKAIIEGRRAEREALRANRTLAELKKTAPTLLALAKTESTAQQFDSALEKLEAAVALDPTLTDAYWQRTWILLGQERWLDALAAMRIAQDHDSAAKRSPDLLPAIEQLAAARTEAERWSSEPSRVVFRHLSAADAAGPVLAFAGKLNLQTEQRLQLILRQLRPLWGRQAELAKVINGEVYLNIGGIPIRTLEPLRGLPFEGLNASASLIDSLEPLRGMKLTALDIHKTNISDLGPLQAMPLRVLSISETRAQDFSPLAGMPLKVLSAQFMGKFDLSALRGMRLIELNLSHDDITDLGPLRGLPLSRLAVDWNVSLRDLAPLAESPLEFLYLEMTDVRDLSVLRGKSLRILTLNATRVQDLSPLKGMPLEKLSLNRMPEIADLSPLRGMAIKELSLGKNDKLRDFSPILDLPKLNTLIMPDEELPPQLLELRYSRSLATIHADAFPSEHHPENRPAVEFWKVYDQHHAR